MALKIEIHSDQVEQKSGMSNGRAYNIREQHGFAHLGADPYPTKIKLRLKEGQPPYAPGQYTLHDHSFKVGKYGSLEVEPMLVPAPAAVVQQQNKATG
jgi:hypothetical protein